MAQYHIFDCIMRHETTRYSPTAGEAPPTSYPTFEKGEHGVGCCPVDNRIQEFCSAMARRIRTPRQKRSESEADTRTSTPHDGCPEVATGKVSSQRSFGGGIFHRSLDTAAHFRAHREALSYRIPSQPRLAIVAEPGLECKTQ